MVNLMRVYKEIRDALARAPGCTGQSCGCEPTDSETATACAHTVRVVSATHDAIDCTGRVSPKDAGIPPSRFTIPGPLTLVVQVRAPCRSPRLPEGRGRGGNFRGRSGALRCLLQTHHRLGSSMAVFERLTCVRACGAQVDDEFDVSITYPHKYPLCAGGPSYMVGGESIGSEEEVQAALGAPWSTRVLLKHVLRTLRDRRAAQAATPPLTPEDFLRLLNATVRRHPRRRAAGHHRG